MQNHEIHFPYTLDATPRRWSVYRFADQSVRLFIGAPFASPRRFFQIDDHPDHAQIEARGGCARLPCDAFSYLLFNNLRNLGDIWQFGIVSGAGGAGGPRMCLPRPPRTRYLQQLPGVPPRVARCSDALLLM